MKELDPWYSNFWAGIIMLVIFGGYSIASIYFGWIQHLAWNHTITNAPGEGVMLAGRAALFAYLFTFFGAFMAIVEFREMLEQTKTQPPDYIQKAGRVGRYNPNSVNYYLNERPVNYDPQDILRRRGALYIINGHRFYTEASVLAAMKEASESKWNWVADGLPTKDGKYLITDERSVSLVIWYEGHLIGDNVQDKLSWNFVTRWSPVPEI